MGWKRRPVAATVIRVLVRVAPLGVSAAMVALLWRSPSPSAGVGTVVLQALAMAVVVVATFVVARKVAMLALPLEALYRLDLAFPEALPSRFRLARRVNAQRTLEARVANARVASQGADVTAAAEAVLELLLALDRHDRRTRGHAERVRVFTDVLAIELGLSKEDRDKLRWVALLHDIGKLHVSPALLNKHGAPDDLEWQVLRAHPDAGRLLLGPLGEWLQPWSDGVAQHHERWDGRGYPRGLRGPQICRAARIITLTDSYEVMTAPRSYKPAMTHAQALEELKAHSGTQFDPEMVRAFMAIPLRRMRPTLLGVALPPLARASMDLARMLGGAGTPQVSTAKQVLVGGAAVSVAVMGAGTSFPPTPSASVDAVVATVPRPPDLSLAVEDFLDGELRGDETERRDISPPSPRVFEVGAPAGSGDTAAPVAPEDDAAPEEPALPPSEPDGAASEVPMPPDPDPAPPASPAGSGAGPAAASTSQPPAASDAADAPPPGASASAPAAPEPAPPDQQPEPVQSEPVQSEPVQSEPVQSEPVQSEPVQSDPSGTAPAEDHRPDDDDDWDDDDGEDGGDDEDWDDDRRQGGHGHHQGHGHGHEHGRGKGHDRHD